MKNIETTLNVDVGNLNKALQKVIKSFKDLQKAAEIKISVQNVSPENNRFQRFIKRLFRIK